ncbi:hypothetical protein VM1G_03836 [Cytospora mali]|uniref:Uncharacterized protein n=1 Tax=Cytospora mali TaxID=578113 RepID=A0A194VV86_CYTMA|nr:hypothetical protein VM1G_03836 [Valsa mali]
MESTLRRVTVASKQFLNTPSFRPHRIQGPSLCRYVKHSSKGGKRKDPLMQTFAVPLTSPTLALAAFDLRKRLARTVSHGQNLYGSFLESFGLKPVSGYWVLKQTEIGAWMVTNPTKGFIKFIHDSYDSHGRIRSAKPCSMDEMLEKTQYYTNLLKDANRFVEDFCRQFDIKLSKRDTAAEGSAASPEVPSGNLKSKPGETPLLDFGRRRYQGYVRQKTEGLRKTPTLTEEEKQALIKKARSLLRDSAASRHAKPDWLDSLEIKVYEK